MAENDRKLVVAAAPQTFTWQGRVLHALLSGFSGASPRRSVTHEFPQRQGAREEDMGNGPRWLEAQLRFAGRDCAKRYREFELGVARNPVGLLVHPVAGQWMAFCKGPSYRVDFGRALDELQVPVRFTETELDSKDDSAPRDVATAAQNASAGGVQMEVDVATFMAETAIGRAPVALLKKLDAIAAKISAASDPLTYVRQNVNVVMGGVSRVVGSIATVEAAGRLLKQDLDSYIAQAVALLVVSEMPAGGAAALDTLLASVVDRSRTLEQEMVAAAATPAGAGDAVASVEVAVAGCLSLQESVNAARPPVVTYTVPAPGNLIIVAQRFLSSRGIDGDAVALASEILALNHVPNPASVAAGTKLRVPSR